jgi:8-oxo-dGTP diphosphatase
MTAVDNLWYLATEAEQRAEQRYQDLRERHDDYVEYTPRRRVSRPRFRTVAERIKARGLPYGAHTLTHHPDRGLLLVYHATVEMWVLPGGEVRPDESLTEGARRELEEEAGVDGQVRGLGILGRVQFRCDGHETWGVLPIYETDPAGTDLSVDDPDGEITDARWFEELPERTRDRTVLEQWLDERA